MSAECDGGAFPAVIELNVGGVLYTTTLVTLIKQPDTQLYALFTGRETIQRDTKGRYFLDSDGVLFRYVLDYLRDGTIILPDCFREKERLRKEAEKYLLPGPILFFFFICSLNFQHNHSIINFIINLPIQLLLLLFDTRIHN